MSCGNVLRAPGVAAHFVVPASPTFLSQLAASWENILPVRAAGVDDCAAPGA